MSSEQIQPPRIEGVADADRVAIETFYRAFGPAGAVILDEALAPDWQDIPLAPGQAPGRDGMKPLVDAFLAAFPDVQVRVHEMLGVPGRVAVRAEITGTHLGPWFGVGPTGRAFRMPIHEFHEVAEGRVVKTWHLEDWLGWLAQVGAWPAAAGTPEAAR